MRISVFVLIVSLSLPVYADCPQIPHSFVADLLAGKSYTEAGVTYKPTQSSSKTLSQKFRDFVTKNRYKPGRFIEMLPAFDESTQGKKTCIYRIQAGVSKKDQLLVLEASPAK